jgi:hypothetical protein
MAAKVLDFKTLMLNIKIHVAAGPQGCSLGCRR